jgi:hypothetical protein
MDFARFDLDRFAGRGLTGKREYHMNDQKTVTDAKASPKLAWETPSMEEVSERVMAQPYIRFT